MSLDLLVQLVHAGEQNNWTERNEAAYKSLFGSADGRYPAKAEKAVQLRAPKMSADAGVPFAAYIHSSNPQSGPYSGLSFVMFPVSGEACLFGLVVGTQGLAPDDAILGRPGHARKAQAICAWLNRKFGGGAQVAWAKQDPTRTDMGVPEDLRQAWSTFKDAFERYGKEMYALFRPGTDTQA